jgi:hypothetical protein
MLNLTSNIGSSTENALLSWCRHVTKYYSNINITNFSTSFKDGLALCAILDRYYPSLINYNSLSKDRPIENLNLAFDVSKKLGIQQCLDAKGKF